MIEVDDVTDPNTIDSTTIKRYASNIYEKLKTVFKSSFLNDPLSFFSHVNSSPDKKNIVNDDRNVIYIDKTRFDELLKKSMTYQVSYNVRTVTILVMYILGTGVQKLLTIIIS